MNIGIRQKLDDMSGLGPTAFIFQNIPRKITGPSKCIHRCDGEFGSALACAAGSAVVDKIVAYSHASIISAMALSALSVPSEMSDAPKYRA
jgi:hypothetical protein